MSSKSGSDCILSAVCTEHRPWIALCPLRGRANQSLIPLHPGLVRVTSTMQWQQPNTPADPGVRSLRNHSEPSFTWTIKGFPQAYQKLWQNPRKHAWWWLQTASCFSLWWGNSYTWGGFGKKNPRAVLRVTSETAKHSLIIICHCWICLQWSLIHEKEICVRSPLVVTAPLNLTTSCVVLFHCCGSPTEWGILGDNVHDTIPWPGLGLHRLGLEEISGDWRWLSLGSAVLETGVAQICHEGFSITVAATDSCLVAPWLDCLTFANRFGLPGFKMLK